MRQAVGAYGAVSLVAAAVCLLPCLLPRLVLLWWRCLHILGLQAGFRSPAGLPPLQVMGKHCRHRSLLRQTLAGALLLRFSLPHAGSLLGLLRCLLLLLLLLLLLFLLVGPLLL